METGKQLWAKSKVTLAHLMKQKRNFKDETNLKNNFQNTSQQHAHLEASLSLEKIFRQLLQHFFPFSGLGTHTSALVTSQTVRTVSG